MERIPFSVDPKVQKARTLPGEFYRNPFFFDKCREQVFAKAWHCIGLKDELEDREAVQPFELLPGFLSEPLVLSRDAQGNRRCLSNVCTHRANLLVTEPGPCQEIRCRYHGRRFGLDGKMKSMPEFSGVEDFPSETDHLPSLPLDSFGPLLFTNLDRKASFAEWIRPVKERISWMKPEEFFHAPEYSALYEIEAHWALYVDNYLEGFHIPFVHPALNQVLDFGDYRYEMFPQGVLQIGMAKEGQPYFDIPGGQKESGQKVAAYYFWMFPNLMLNVYPWGLSLNIVEPISPTQTRIRFETFLWEGKEYDQENQDFTHMVEMEDEAVVEAVHKGVQSRLYQHGRFSVKREPGVHHFHRLLEEAMKK
ncbi:MAG: aromatic ring-hydroxylating dioxygenase subunit alpha [Bacteroidia bacterium]|nr:aromatic ring-hydroxylating dioxygenase subunit alpha [Bacteroidia bacterium]